MRVVHVAPRVQARGGIESLLELHRQMPGRQDFVALFDRHAAVRADYANLGFSWRTPLWLMRKRFREALASRPGALVVYHNGWGLPLFHDLDASARRVVVLHAEPAYHRPELPGWEGLVDGALGSCPGLEEFWRAEWSGLDEHRRTVFRMPVEIDAVPSRQAKAGPLVLGYAGRLERPQKCIQLLPRLARALIERGIDFRFEVLGDGPMRNWLRARTNSRVTFHGWIASRAGYARMLATWDAAIYFSEHEGGPIALLEAMAMGAIPFYPARHGSWADMYVPQVDRRCHYPPGDMPALAAAIAEVFRASPDSIAEWRRRAQALVAPHSVAQFQETCAGFLARIAGSPRLSAARPRRVKFTDCLPLGFVTRFLPSALRRS